MGHSYLSTRDALAETNNYTVEDRGYKTPCHIWAGQINFYGYGALKVDGKQWRAHRYLWGKSFGPIPSGLEPDHLCRVRSCVNVHHLELVTHRENVMRGRAPTVLIALSGRCGKGHPMTPGNVNVSRDGKRHCRQCQRDRHAIEFQPAKIEPRKCAQCGREFTPKFQQRKYCDAGCEILASKERSNVARR